MYRARSGNRTVSISDPFLVATGSLFSHSKEFMSPDPLAVSENTSVSILTSVAKVRKMPGPLEDRASHCSYSDCYSGFYWVTWEDIRGLGRKQPEQEERDQLYGYDHRWEESGAVPSCLRLLGTQDRSGMTLSHRLPWLSPFLSSPPPSTHEQKFRKFVHAEEGY